MNKEFVPYEQALALKELGFDEECFAYYNLKEEITFKSCHNRVPIIMSGKKCGIPLYQQAFRWFREKYDLHSYIRYTEDIEHFYEFIIDMKVGRKMCYTYEEAELACLIKLIEIVKESDNENSI